MKVLNYPVAIETGDDFTVFGVVVPDLPGCFSAGDTMEEAIENAKEAIAAWIEVAMDEGKVVPAPGSMANHVTNPEFKGWLWALVEVDGLLIDDEKERVNISLPKRILTRIDRAAASHGETRSGFLANAALSRILAEQRVR